MACRCKLQCIRKSEHFCEESWLDQNAVCWFVCECKSHLYTCIHLLLAGGPVFVAYCLFIFLCCAIHDQVEIQSGELTANSLNVQSYAHLICFCKIIVCAIVFFFCHIEAKYLSNVLQNFFVENKIYVRIKSVNNLSVEFVLLLQSV